MSNSKLLCLLVVLMAGLMTVDLARGHDRKVVGYFIEWGVYDRDYLVKDIPVDKLTHLNFAFIAPFILPGEYELFDSIPENIYKKSDGSAPKQPMYIVGVAQCTISNNTYSVGLAVDDTWACFQKTNYDRRYHEAPLYSWAKDPYAGWNKPGEGDAPGPKDRTAGIFGELSGMKIAFPSVKILVSIGGWSYSYYFSELASHDVSRKAFALACKEMLDLFAARGSLPELFDGVDLDWEFPYTGGDSAVAHLPDDKDHLTALCREVRQQIGTGKLLTIATAQNYQHIPNQYDVALEDYLDFASIMAYDYSGGWLTKTGLEAPLFGGNTNDPLYNPADGKYIVVSEVVSTFLNQGFDAAKLVMGLPFYGRTFDNVNNANNGLYQPFEGLGIGSYDLGSVEFNDITDGRAKPENQILCRVGDEWAGTNGYTRYWDEISKTPYLFNGNCMVSYDDDVSLAAKVAFAMEKGLGGVMIWELSCDTRANSAYQENLLMDAVDKALRSPLAPTGVSVGNGTSPSGINLAWNASDGADYYEIWRQDARSFDHPTLVADEVAGTHYYDDNVELNKTYYYKIKAKNEHGTSGFSAIGSGFALSPDLAGEPDIRINNLPDAEVYLQRGQPLSLYVKMSLTQPVAIDADLWLLVNTPAGWYHYCYNSGGVWRSTSLMPLSPAYQGKLFDFSGFYPVWTGNTSELPVGSYTFYFGFDTSMDGVLDVDAFYKSVRMQLTN